MYENRKVCILCGAYSALIHSFKNHFRFPYLFQIHRLGDLFDVAGVTVPRGSELSLDQPNNAYCNTPALSTQCGGDKRSVSWGDESGT